MADKLDELRKLADNNEGINYDLLFELVQFTNIQDIVDELIDFLRNNPNATTRSMLDYLIFTGGLQHIVIRDYDGAIYEQEEWQAIQKERDYKEFLESGISDSRTILNNLKVEFADNPEALENIESHCQSFPNETPFNAFIFAKSLRFLALNNSL